MNTSRRTPSATTRRPAEPFRPLPARALGISLLAVRARRRRHRRGILPPKAGERGW